MNRNSTHQPDTAISPTGTNAPVEIALVGHCGPDAYLLRSAVQRAIPNASVAMVTDEGALRREHWRPSHILLINRVLDGRFRAEGTELIREAASDADGPIAMLISNYEDAQQAAIAVGALPGFGKRALYDPETAGKLRTAVERALDAARPIEER